jgi:alkylation response protein AidB-like acyl-CoA dehydrogenase
LTIDGARADDRVERLIYDSDHEQFRASVRGFVQDVYRPLHEEIRAAHQIPRSVWLEAGKLGLLGLEMPEV